MLIHMYSSVCEDQRSVLSVFLISSPPYFEIRALFLNMKLSDSSRWPSQPASEILLLLTSWLWDYGHMLLCTTFVPVGWWLKTGPQTCIATTLPTDVSLQPCIVTLTPLLSRFIRVSSSDNSYNSLPLFLCVLFHHACYIFFFTFSLWFLYDLRKKLLTLNFTLVLVVHLREYMCICICMYVYECRCIWAMVQYRNKRTFFGSLFSSRTLWDPWIELRLSRLHAGCSS